MSSEWDGGGAKRFLLGCWMFAFRAPTGVHVEKFGMTARVKRPNTSELAYEYLRIQHTILYRATNELQCITGEASSFTHQLIY